MLPDTQAGDLIRYEVSTEYHGDTDYGVEGYAAKDPESPTPAWSFGATPVGVRRN
jgi:hypothetical protein